MCRDKSSRERWLAIVDKYISNVQQKIEEVYEYHRYEVNNIRTTNQEHSVKYGEPFINEPLDKLGVDVKKQIRELEKDLMELLEEKRKIKAGEHEWLVRNGYIEGEKYGN